MPFSFYETYRTEGVGLLTFPMLRGASNVEAGHWLFFGSDHDTHQIFTPSFNVVRAERLPLGVIAAEVETGEPLSMNLRFIPLTAVYIREHPDKYDWIPASALRQLDEPGMMSLLFTGLIPEWYVEKFGPPQEREEDAP